MPSVADPHHRRDARGWLTSLPSSYPFQRLLQSIPALGPVTGLLVWIPLGHPPFLRQLRRRASQPRFVRRFLRYYGAVRLLGFVHRILIPLGFNARTPPNATFGEVKPEISRLPREKLPHMPWFSDRAGVRRTLPWRHVECCLPLAIRRSASRLIIRFRGSIARTAGSPVNASSAPSRTPSHDSGPA